jgi:NAD(P)-dependent dehydrogenase (short-subunit alcohol dehydrogenase family)
MDKPLALVTGGLHRVGAAIAARLARAGYALALHKRSAGSADEALIAAIQETGAPCHCIIADLADSAEVAGIMPAITQHFGRVPDVLVNNASLFLDGEWPDLTAATLQETMQVNHHAPVMLAQMLVAAHQGPRRPVIVNILDQRVVNPVPDQLAYSLSKQALWQATSTLAVAFGGKARVNGVAPGLTLPTADYSDQQMARLAARMPLGALPTPDEIADAVAYLVQAESVTGQTIFVDGGAHLASFDRDFVNLERD